MRETTDNLKCVLNRGGFDVKGLTTSGIDPTDNLSTDGSIGKRSRNEVVLQGG